VLPLCLLLLSLLLASLGGSYNKNMRTKRQQKHKQKQQQYHDESYKNVVMCERTFVMLANDCAACALDRSANTLWRKEGYYEVKKRLVTTKLSFNHLDLN